MARRSDIMRVAFDLDDTLIPGRVPFPVYPLPRNPIRRMFCCEPLRTGSVKLIGELQDLGHEVWIYTTSYRHPFRTKLMFRAYGARIRRVINQSEHLRKMAEMNDIFQHCTKFPPAFGINLLVDECSGVVAESQRFGFEVVQVQPDDPDWAAKVLERVSR